MQPQDTRASGEVESRLRVQDLACCLRISGKLVFREKTAMERNIFQRMSGETGIL